MYPSKQKAKEVCNEREQNLLFNAMYSQGMHYPHASVSHIQRIIQADPERSITQH